MDYRRDHDLGLSFPVYGARGRGGKRFTDSQGVIHITSQGEAEKEKGATGEDDQAPVPRPAFERPGNKLDKMRILGIHPPDEKRAESPKTPVSEAKTTPTREENH